MLPLITIPMGISLCFARFNIPTNQIQNNEETQ